MKNFVVTAILGAMLVCFYIYSLTWVGELIWFLSLAIAYYLGNRALKAVEEYLAWKEVEIQILREAGISVED